MSMVTIIKEEKHRVLEMAKLMSRHADPSKCDEFEGFIYFSQVQSGHSPRVKFYGGTSQTETTARAPSLMFGVDGAKELVLQPWMNKNNCPNAFNTAYVESIRRFVNRQKPLLLLVWFKHVDESDALRYFQGVISLREAIEFMPEYNGEEIDLMEELDEFCLNNNLYRF